MEHEDTQVVADQPEAKAKGDAVERKYFVSYIPYGVTSFQELDAVVASREMTDELYDLNYQFMALMENILFSAEVIEDLPARIRALSLEFANRVDRVLNGEKIEAKEISAWLPKDLHQSLADKPQGAFLLKQASDGQWWWYGKPTNNFQDRDGEILTEAAHQDFVSYLAQYRAANPSVMPELQLWHDEDTAFSMPAEWVDWADNALHLAGRLTDKEAASLFELSKKYDLAMSHGFWVLERKDNLITKYRMFEASVLPREFAANIYTDFNVMEKTKMAFSPEQRKFLVDALGEDWVNTQESNNVKSAEALRQNVEHKDYVTKEEFATVQTAIEQINAALTQIATHLTAPVAEAPAEPPVEDDKAAPPPMSNVADLLAHMDPTNAKPVGKSNPLAQAKPDETPDDTKSFSNPIVGAVHGIISRKPVVAESEGE